jgi:hypothetical protein
MRTFPLSKDLMRELDAIDQQTAGNRLGCLLVLLPALAFFFVMPDAAHVWSSPWSNPLLWLLSVVASWFGLRWLINRPIAALQRPTRFLAWGLLLAASVALAVFILRSV